ncbi:hypothetical protein AGMMS49579_26740 [Spirochaetia bacterium]|nr:hypothetical protein AGMMS49579_26740 [Spirochaetia bacterium]
MVKFRIPEGINRQAEKWYIHFMLTVQNVTKTYGSRKAVDDISFTLGDHGILGFLGPNGAGKSTTMNIIAGYTSSAAGTVMVNGHEILDDPIGAKKNVGYLPERPPPLPGHDGKGLPFFHV